jgi:molybdopterin molybdotransferase
MTEATPVASLQEIGSCVGGYDPKALPVTAARDFLQRLVPRLQAVEKLALRSALGRVLAEDIVSPIDVPAQDNSAMDGYAFRAADLAVGDETVLEVVGSGFAGGDVATAIGPGQCVRIMTGATMPAGLDTVVPQEFVRADGPRIVLAAGVVRQGENRRFAGEDLARGAIALAAGRLLRPADIGVLASLGRAEVPVFGACASPSSPPATSCARSARRSPRARSTTATATPSGRCCSDSASTCSTWAWSATTPRRSRPRSAPPPTPPMR